MGKMFNFKFGEYNVCCRNSRQCAAVAVKVNSMKKEYEDILKYETEEKDKQHLKNKIDELNITLKEIEKAINKFNDYSCIDVKVYGDWDKKSTVIKFNKDWSNDKIKRWLQDNDYPVGSEYIPTCEDYDCSGKVHYIDFILKNQIVTITEYRDV